MEKGSWKNVIFLDFDGVLYGYHDLYDENLHRVDESIQKERLEQKIKILSEICSELDCKIVIGSSYKDCIDEETLETDIGWINEIFDLFKKYNIELIGRTPLLSDIKENYTGYPSIWKEDEILGYLDKHKEIEAYCVIDDDDLKATRRKSDLDKVREYLVETKFYDEKNPSDEGLQEYHKEEVRRIINKQRKIRRL